MKNMHLYLYHENFMSLPT